MRRESRPYVSPGLSPAPYTRFRIWRQTAGPARRIIRTPAVEYLSSSRLDRP